MFDTTRVIRRPRITRHTPRVTDGEKYPVLVRHVAPKPVI